MVFRFENLQMVPAEDECGTVNSTSDDKSNARYCDSSSAWHLYDKVSDAENECHGHQINTKIHSFTSQTDKPALAHDVYVRWLAVSSQNVTCTLPQRLPLNRNDLLIAAYTGSTLMYRK